MTPTGLRLPCGATDYFYRALATSIVSRSSTPLTHLIDDAIHSFYRCWGIQDVPSDTCATVIVRIVDLEANGIAA